MQRSDKEAFLAGVGLALSFIRATQSMTHATYNELNSKDAVQSQAHDLVNQLYYSLLNSIQALAKDEANRLYPNHDPFPESSKGSDGTYIRKVIQND